MLVLIDNLRSLRRLLQAAPVLAADILCGTG
jgi:hypothetical protein